MQKYLGWNQNDSTNELIFFECFFFACFNRLLNFLVLKLSDWEIENEIEFSFSSSSSSSLLFDKIGRMGPLIVLFKLNPPIFPKLLRD